MLEGRLPPVAVMWVRGSGVTVRRSLRVPGACCFRSRATIASMTARSNAYSDARWATSAVAKAVSACSRRSTSAIPKCNERAGLTVSDRHPRDIAALADVFMRMKARSRCHLGRTLVRPRAESQPGARSAPLHVGLVVLVADAALAPTPPPAAGVPSSRRVASVQRAVSGHRDFILMKNWPINDAGTHDGPARRC